MGKQLTDYQKGYLAGIKDQPKRKAAIFTREIKPGLLDYPVFDKKMAYASPRDWEEIRKFFDGAKKDGCEVVAIAFPEALGDNYLDFICLLSLIAEYGFYLGIVGKSPFLVEWERGHFPIFKVEKR